MSRVTSYGIECSSGVGQAGRITAPVAPYPEGAAALGQDGGGERALEDGLPPQGAVPVAGLVDVLGVVLPLGQVLSGGGEDNGVTGRGFLGRRRAQSGHSGMGRVAAQPHHGLRRVDPLSERGDRLLEVLVVFRCGNRQERFEEHRSLGMFSSVVEDP
jgi:hypothetical protein